MALLDDENKAIVLRVVYAGPPMSGKTETLRALAQHLLGSRAEQAVFSPDEAHGRTLFFDWLEYSGGLFQGRKVRSQIVSVPGQAALADRRRLLLSAADAVVFVVDAHIDQREAVTHFFSELREFSSRPESEPPVGIIVQANKMDLPDALSIEALREMLGDSANLAVVPTIASQGKGIREAFVQAVGLGLARAKELFDSGQLKRGKADIDSGEDLLKRMTALEEARFGPPQSVGAQRSVVDRAERNREELAPKRLSAIVQEAFGLAEVDSGDRISPAGLHGAEGTAVMADQTGLGTKSLTPKLPSRNPNAGSLWPTVAGRIIVHEISDLPLEIEQRADQSWLALAGNKWQFLSLPQHSFGSDADARNEMLKMARRHVELKHVLSEHRCIAYCASGMGDWRIWQVVRRDKTLADVLDPALKLPQAEMVATELFQIAHLLWSAIFRFGDNGFSRDATLGTVAVNAGLPVYTGFVDQMEFDLELVDDATTPATPGTRLRNELSAAVGNFAASRQADLPRVLRQLESLMRQEQNFPEVAETLIAMFIGH